ncbi:CoA pyrophosphatase [Rhodoferax lacus]|uniref:CoA pyrophosphatase n=1 Tax=Rhodoferax lacus TaxID=2184758 RepID=A0A3E1RC94_9BURK|nr:CoA pyrophosphatase [Rhodoferax lacus]
MALPPSFDPKAVPVQAVDRHLPKVSAASLTPQAIAARFARQHAWEPELRQEAKFMDRPPAHASVLIPLVQRERLTVLLTLRPTHMSSHSGQIAFPGGKADPEDQDAVATALREAEEEVGLQPGFVQVMGSLPVYTTGSAFIVTPVVALVRPGFQLQANADEVDEVFEVPLDFLMDPAHHRHHVVDFAGGQRNWLSMPYQDGSTERFIWGATAGMLRNFYRFLLD